MKKRQIHGEIWRKTGNPIWSYLAVTMGLLKGGKGMKKTKVTEKQKLVAYATTQIDAVIDAKGLISRALKEDQNG